MAFVAPRHGRGILYSSACPPEGGRYRRRDQCCPQTLKPVLTHGSAIQWTRENQNERRIGDCGTRISFAADCRHWKISQLAGDGARARGFWRRHGYRRSAARQSDRPHEGIIARLHRPRENIYTAEYGWMLQRRRGGSRGPLGTRGGIVELGEARSDWGPANFVSRHGGTHSRDADSGERRLYCFAVYE